MARFGSGWWLDGRFSPALTAPGIGGGGLPTLTDDLAAAILADTPWAYYQLGESAGATSYADSSGNSRNLAEIVATVTAGSTALCAPGTSVDFSGTGHITCTSNQYGTAQNASFNGDKAITLSCVVNLDALTGDPVLFHLGTAGNNGSQGVFLNIRSTGAVRFQLFDTTSGDYKFFDSAASVITASTSYIIHARREVGGACKIAVNGTSVATGTMTGTIGMSGFGGTGGQRIMLGSLNGDTPSNKLNGRMQHSAVFDTALSDAQISAQYAASGL